MKTHRTPILLFVLLLLSALLLAACGNEESPTSTPEAATPQATATSAPAAAPTPAAAPGEETLSWSAPPPLTIDPDKNYIATFKTEKGDITVELYADKAPQTVNNFIFLAREGFYDDTTFHRVLDGFMAQGGDPTGSGSGGPGYTIPDEIDADLVFDRPGLLAMANTGVPNSGGSQWFITFAETPWLNSRHTIFGEVIDGMEVLDQLTLRDPDENPDFAGDTLNTIEISETSQSRRATPTPVPTPFAPDVSAEDHFMAAMPPAERAGYFNTAPDFALDPEQIYVATFHTEVGDIVVELLPELAPNNVNSFVALANAGYYDGTHFYQVIEDLVAIGGDPLENGRGGVGYTLDSELQPGVFNDAGWLGSAQQGPNAAGQFFFTLDAASHLATNFTPLGRVIEGQENLAEIEVRDPNLAGEDDPGTLLQSVEIGTAGASRLPTPTPTPTPFSPTLPGDEERPLSQLSPQARDNYYNTAPDMQIDPDQDYVAIIRTAVGDITIDLFEKEVPAVVNNFVVLAENGFYDETTFHRVLDGFMAQAGDPTGSGGGGPGYSFPDEFSPDLHHDRAGIVSMANRGYGTNGSQFFITFDATPWLDAYDEQGNLRDCENPSISCHAIFGEVIEGMDVLDQIERRDPAATLEPGTTITRIDIETR